MRDSSRVILARAASHDVVGAACKGAGEWWGSVEVAHANARTSADAEAAAAPALERCAECAAIDECVLWARLDHYTGLAAGAAWINGQQHSTAVVRQHPIPDDHRQQLAASA